MRAAVLEQQGKPLVLRDDVEIQDPGPGQVRVRVSHCGLCHSDLSVIDGAFPSSVPVVLGHEAAGVVDKVGPGVRGLAVGDHVVLTPCPPCGRCYWCVRNEASHCEQSLGLYTHSFPDGSTGISRKGEKIGRGLNVGAFAEYTLAAETAAVKVPKEVPLDVVCVIGCAVQTGVGAVFNTAKVEEGATVLVLGLGGIGLSVVQGARIAGAARIIAVDPLPERRNAAKAMGATDSIDPTQEDVQARVREIAPVGVDYAFECAGKAKLVEAGIAAARNGGTIVAVGAPPLAESITITPAAAFTASGKRLLGTILGGVNSLREIPRLVALWQTGRLQLESLITGHRPLADINAALDDLRAGKGIRTVLDC
jgi:S-(hydroxymethyl)glutathione dehydrogenase/alcohol dehydrogenase